MLLIIRKYIFINTTNILGIVFQTYSLGNWTRICPRVKKIDRRHLIKLSLLDTATLSPGHIQFPNSYVRKTETKADGQHPKYQSC
jgi:hypothetical protein